jgi:hypothetical protein
MQMPQVRMPLSILGVGECLPYLFSYAEPFINLEFSPDNLIITWCSGIIALYVLSAIHRRRFLEKKTNDSQMVAS